MPTHARRHAERDGQYAEGSTCFMLTKPVTAHLLDEQITAEMGWRNRAGVVVEGDPSTASEDSPVFMWVLRADVDHNTVKRVVTAHQGVEDDSDDEFDALVAKAQSGEDLSAHETQAALRLLLLRGTR